MRVRTDLRQHFVTGRVINIWNSLDEESVSAVFSEQFQTKVAKKNIPG